MNIKPERDLYPHIMSVKTPGRYVGGEYGVIMKTENVSLKCAVAFPDLYEIGMSNLAVKILYNRLNSIAGVSCERVFAPDFDFEQLLVRLSVPLYTLETGIPLHELDVLGFSVGYELSATNILSILDLGRIPLHTRDRSEHDPIVIAGGPAVTNPAPLSRFIDAFFIGESEQYLSDLFGSLAQMKKSGASRADLLHRMIIEPSCYHPDKQEMTRASAWSGFGSEPSVHRMPVPAIKAIQDNGIVEIMRGCPNGCRFCHAGIFYRPFRMKPFRDIEREIGELVRTCGYREITLSSLSSGDYTGIVDLVRRLNILHASDKVSFSLPSLRINSLTFPLLEELSSVRKSGLTFAVETPTASWQRGLNKPVDYDNLMALIAHAKEHGWRQAKFYFMIGLPVSGSMDDTSPICSFLNEVQHETGLQIHANVGTFIPKPHTPFQWSAQLTEKQSFEKIDAIKRGLRSRNIKLGFNSPFQSYLEGVLARGDDRVGDLIEKAYRAGARFDAWEDLIRKNLWREVFESCAWNIESELFSVRPFDAELPWDRIDLGVKKKVLKTEYEKSLSGESTDPCDFPCSHPCGVCAKDSHPKVLERSEQPLQNDTASETSLPSKEAEPVTALSARTQQVRKHRMLFSFSKSGKGIFLSHLNVMSVFERSFLRAGIRTSFTEGYNPKPRIEFAQPLSLGFSSDEEMCACYLDESIDPIQFTSLLNDALPEGLKVLRAVFVNAGSEAVAKKSLMAVYGGSDYYLDVPESAGMTPEKLSCEISGKASNIKILTSSAEHILLQIPSDVTGGLNGFIKSVLRGNDVFTTGMRVTRKKMYCTSPNGITDYFNFFSRTSVTPDS